MASTRTTTSGAGSSAWTTSTGTGLWCSTKWLTLPSTAERTAPRPREPMTTRSWRPSSMRLRIALRIGFSVRTVVTDTSSGTRSTASRSTRSAYRVSSGPSVAAAPADIAIIAVVRGSAAPVMSVSFACSVRAMSIASSSARSACGEPSTATRMLRNIGAPPLSRAREGPAQRARARVEDDDMRRRVTGDPRGDARRERGLVRLGPEDDRAGAELGRAAEDPLGDIGVAADAADDLARDRDAGGAQLGDAGVEQRPRLVVGLAVGRVLAGEHVALGDVEHLHGGAPGARQGHGERAHLERARPADGDDHRGGVGGRDSGPRLDRRLGPGRGPGERAAVGPQHARAQRCHDRTEVERRADRHVLRELARDERGDRAAAEAHEAV